MQGTTLLKPVHTLGGRTDLCLFGEWWVLCICRLIKEIKMFCWSIPSSRHMYLLFIRDLHSVFLLTGEKVFKCTVFSHIVLFAGSVKLCSHRCEKVWSYTQNEGSSVECTPLQRSWKGQTRPSQRTETLPRHFLRVGTFLWGIDRGEDGGQSVVSWHRGRDVGRGLR